MSVTESKAKTERKSSRKPAKTQETVLSALLAQTEEVSVPLASLIKSPLNVRTVPYSVESVSELAESINVAALRQGTSGAKIQTSTETGNQHKYQTRVVSNANKVNLKFEEAKPVLEDQLAKSIANIL